MCVRREMEEDIGMSSVKEGETSKICSAVVGELMDTEQNRFRVT